MNCVTCRWAEKDHEEDDLAWVTCHRYPPKSLSTTPILRRLQIAEPEKEWCGEWKEKNG